MKDTIITQELPYLLTREQASKFLGIDPNSFRAQISLCKNGQHKKLTKSFDKKSEAKRWALENELEKGNGKQLAERSTTFAVYFENWIYIIKKMMSKKLLFKITNVLQVLLNDFLVTFS